MRTAILLLTVALLPSVATAAEIPKGQYKLITKGTDGSAATDDSDTPAISSNGKSLAITTLSSNFGPETFNGFRQVVRFTTQGQPVESISRMAGGQLANHDCSESRLSKSGRYVAFECKSALGLVGPPGGSYRVFRRDTKTGELVHVSLSPTGEVANDTCLLNDISDNGRFVLFTTMATNMVAGSSPWESRGFLHDVETGTTELVTVNEQGLPLDGSIFTLDISGDARFVFFSSNAPNLGNGSQFQIYVRDRQLGTTTLLSKNSAGVAGADTNIVMSVSRNGRYILMYTASSNLGVSLKPGNLVVLDRKKSEMRALDIEMPGMTDEIAVEQCSISNDGRRVVLTAEYTKASTGATVGKMCEFDRKTGKRWTIVSKTGSNVSLAKLSFSASAKGDWIFFATSFDLLESNGKSDGYLYRAH